MIHIDYIAGSHGSFLCNVLNSIVNDVVDLPFDYMGASHKPIEYKNQMFDSKHYSVFNEQHKLTNIIKINFEHQNLLKLQCLLFKRGRNCNIEIDELEIDTVNKLKDSPFNSVLLNLFSSYQAQLVDYATTPNVPRYVLREFFKFGFLNPEQNGLVTELNKMKYRNPAMTFEFNWFYNFDQFSQGIANIFKFFNINATYNNATLRHFYDPFINGNQYANIEQPVQNILNSVLAKEYCTIPKLHLMQEAWLNAELEKKYQIEMPFNQLQYFSNTQEIIEYINE